MEISIKQEFFGKTIDGEDVYKYTFVGGKIEVSVLNYGGAISNIYVPDKNGKVEDIALGYDDVAGYEDNFPYIGVIVGRVAGRIAGGKFRLDDQDYQLVINNGPNNIHGGIKGFSRRVWDAVVDGDKLVLTYKSPDGEEGFPGEITTTVVYTLTIDGCLNLEYTATSTKPCPFNLTNHSYFNLKGQDSDDVFDHLVKINAEKCVPVDENLIPTGELANVEGTINDLRSLTLLRDREKDVREGSLDLTYCIGEEGQMKFASRVIHPQTGRFIDTYTTEEGLQFYTAKYMPKIKGKNGKIYQPFGSFCLETQRFPDSINHSNFPDCVLRPGQTYSQTTTFKFGVSTEKETQ